MFNLRFVYLPKCVPLPYLHYRDPFLDSWVQYQLHLNLGNIVPYTMGTTCVTYYSLSYYSHSVNTNGVHICRWLIPYWNSITQAFFFFLSDCLFCCGGLLGSWLAVLPVPLVILPYCLGL